LPPGSRRRLPDGLACPAFRAGYVGCGFVPGWVGRTTNYVAGWAAVPDLGARRIGTSTCGWQGLVWLWSRSTPCPVGARGSFGVPTWLERGWFVVRG
jgi:hypothetical protein